MKGVIALAICIGVAMASYDDHGYENRGHRDGYGHRNGGHHDDRHRGYDNRGYTKRTSYVSHNNNRGHDRHGYGDNHNDGYRHNSYHTESYHGDQHADRHDDSYGKPKKEGYGQKVSYHKETHYYKPKPKSCYQCAYSPPKTYYDKKVVVERGHYHGSGHDRHDRHDSGYGRDQKRGYGGSYTKKSVHPVPYTVAGGWDKCMGPFNDYQAKDYGVDVWDCHSNCYTRKDKNGDVFRGCYKGEYGVDPHRLGCQKQAGSTWCFCKGDKCNNGPAPY